MVQNIYTHKQTNKQHSHIDITMEKQELYAICCGQMENIRQVQQIMCK